MDANDLREMYESGELSKHDYIKNIHKQHDILFSYSKFLNKSGIKKIEITENGIVMTSKDHDIKMVCDPIDERAIPMEILNFGPYEKNDSDIAWVFLNDCENVLDIGTNFGWYSLLWAKTFPKMHINAYEPVPKTYEYLQANIKLNRLRNISTFNFGFSNKTELARIMYNPKGSGNTSLQELNGDKNSIEIIANFIMLDSLIDTSADFIKCDVEGAELLVLLGGKEFIQKNKPILFIELVTKWTIKFGYHPNDVIKLLDTWGYNCFSVKNGILNRCNEINETTLENNFFFLHREKHADKGANQ